ncbi:MAG: type 1 fimbrial protein [Ottowia sp.]|nr:type 1 fimbrial protein [Ottowia sp.]
MHIYKKLTLATAVLSTFTTIAIAQNANDFVTPDLGAKNISLRFEGEIANATCEIVIAEAPAKTVKLETIGVAAFNATDNAQLAAKGTTFAVTLTACPIAPTTVQAKFTQAGGTAGILDNTATGSYAPTNVGIALSRNTGVTYELVNNEFFDLVGTEKAGGLANQKDYTIDLRAAYHKKDDVAVTAGKVIALAELQVSYK